MLCKAVNVKPHSVCQALLLQELLLMTTGFVAESSFCVPRAATNNVVYWLIFHTVLVYSIQNRDRHSQDILILQGTKHQLFLCDKIPMMFFSLMPILPISSVSGPLEKHGLKNTGNNMRNPNKCRQLLAALWGHDFPRTYSEIEMPLWPTPLGRGGGSNFIWVWFIEINTLDCK